MYSDGWTVKSKAIASHCVQEPVTTFIFQRAALNSADQRDLENRDVPCGMAGPRFTRGLAARSVWNHIHVGGMTSIVRQ